MSPVNRESDTYLVPAVVNAVKLLEALRDRGPDLSTTELANLSGLNQSTVHKLMATLVHCGMATRSERTKRFNLSPTLAAYGSAALNQLDIRRVARPHLRKLSEISGETAVLGLLQDDRVILIDKREPPLEIRVSPFVGQPMPAAATAHGKALMAWMELPEVTRLLEKDGLPLRTTASIASREEFIKELEETRSRGYAIDRDEYVQGVSGVAAPIFGGGQRAFATLSIVGPSFRVDEQKLKEYGRLCAETALTLSTGASSLGGD